MTNAQIILDYAYSHNGNIVRRDFISWVSREHPDVSPGGCDVALRQMVKEGLLEREGRGTVVLAQGAKKQFLPKLPETVVSIFNSLKGKYPYTRICAWHTSAVSPFTQHVPYTNNVIVEVEREAAEAIFLDLKETSQAQALYAPSEKDYLLYSSKDGNIIVRPMISESPTMTINGVVTPALEKILVDMTIEPEFGFARGEELYIIFENAAESFAIDRRKMLRYASRRGRREIIEELLKSTTL